jgi:hypothetical protein
MGCRPQPLRLVPFMPQSMTTKVNGNEKLSVLFTQHNEFQQFSFIATEFYTIFLEVVQNIGFPLY